MKINIRGLVIVLLTVALTVCIVKLHQARQIVYVVEAEAAAKKKAEARKKARKVEAEKKKRAQAHEQFMVATLRQIDHLHERIVVLEHRELSREARSR